MISTIQLFLSPKLLPESLSDRQEEGRLRMSREKSIDKLKSLKSLESSFSKTMEKMASILNLYNFSMLIRTHLCSVTWLVQKIVSHKLLV